MIDATSAGRPHRSASSAPHWAWSMPKRSRSARTRSAPAGNSRARSSQACSPKTSGSTSLPTSCRRPARWTVSPAWRASSAAAAAPMATVIACRCSWPHDARPLPRARSRKRKVAASSARRRRARRPTSMTAWRMVLARIGCDRAAELAKRSRFAANVASCSRASTRSAAVESWSSHRAMMRSTVASRTGNSARSSMAPAMERAATGSMPSFQGAQSVACFASMALTCIGRGRAPLSGDVVAGRVSEYFPAMTVAFRTCPLCEATCGLALDVDEAAHTVTKVRGDADDVFSHGFLCPKGVSIKELHDDPDRVRTPLVKQPDGSFAPATWDEAFALIADKLPAISAEHGRDAIGAYIGNPAAHSLAFLLYGEVLLKALGTKQIFSASTVDQYPKQAASALMFGSGTT